MEIRRGVAPSRLRAELHITAARVRQAFVRRSGRPRGHRFLHQAPTDAIHAAVRSAAGPRGPETRSPPIGRGASRGLGIRGCEGYPYGTGSNPQADGHAMRLSLLRIGPRLEHQLVAAQIGSKARLDIRTKFLAGAATSCAPGRPKAVHETIVAFFQL